VAQDVTVGRVQVGRRSRVPGARTAARVGALALCLPFAGCSARDTGLEGRVAALEREVEAQRLLVAALRDALKDEGIAVLVPGQDPLADGIARLLAASDRLHAAVSAGDQVRAERAGRAGREALDALAKLPDAAGHLLAAASKAETRAHQSRLVEAAVELAGATLAPQLAALVQDAATPVAVRQQAAKSLLQGADPARGLAEVERLLEREPDFEDLYFLVHLAGETRAPAALPILCRALAAGANPSIRCHAANALAHFPGEQATAALVAAVRGDQHDAVRSNALRALPRASGDRSAVTALAEEVLRGNPSPPLRAAANDVLGQGRAGR